MLTYLIILLDDASTSFCHYDVTGRNSHLIDLDVLKRSIVWAMKENLNVQFVYPDYPLPKEYDELIETIDHTKIKPEAQADGADVVVLTEWKSRLAGCADGATCIIHASRAELEEHEEQLKLLFRNATRVNVVLTDVEQFRDVDTDGYRQLLGHLSDDLVELFAAGRNVQLNLLTDRLMIGHMNNCGAGDSSVTLAPNGRFYICPAFYYNDLEQNDVGDIGVGLRIKNPQLLRLDHSPICRICDAFHCRRCLWMNERLTGDLNTPSHQQCVVSHIERNASRRLQQRLLERGLKFENTKEIPEVDYLDPFDVVTRWK